MQFSRIVLALALAFSGANAFVPANRMWGARMTSVKMFGEVETKLIGIVAEQLGVEEGKVRRRPDAATSRSRARRRRRTPRQAPDLAAERRTMPRRLPPTARL